MNYRDAFSAIVSEVSLRATLVSSKYDEKIFGNFIIAFNAKIGGFSFLNDRGKLYICDGLEADGPCELLLPSLMDEDPRDLTVRIEIALGERCS